MSIIKIESEKVQKRIEEVNKNKIELRPELEKWMMRNEELEQKLIASHVTLVNMTIIIKDYQKALRLKTGQEDNQVQVS